MTKMVRYKKPEKPKLCTYKDPVSGMKCIEEAQSWRLYPQLCAEHYALESKID